MASIILIVDDSACVAERLIASPASRSSFPL